MSNLWWGLPLLAAALGAVLRRVLPRTAAAYGAPVCLLAGVAGVLVWRGVLLDSHNAKTAVGRMDTRRAQELMDSGLIAGGMVPKLRGCIHAVRSGVGEVSILDGRKEHVLLLHMLGQRAAGTTITG